MVLDAAPVPELEDADEAALGVTLQATELVEEGAQDGGIFDADARPQPTPGTRRSGGMRPRQTRLSNLDRFELIGAGGFRLAM